MPGGKEKAPENSFGEAWRSSTEMGTFDEVVIRSKIDVKNGHSGLDIALARDSRPRPFSASGNLSFFAVELGVRDVSVVDLFVLMHVLIWPSAVANMAHPVSSIRPNFCRLLVPAA